MKRVMSILIAGFLVSLVSVAIAADKPESPVTVAGAKTVSATEAKALFDKGVVFVDVRKDKDWDAGRIPGAEHVELKKVFSEDTLGKVAKKDQELVMYCNGPKCMRSSKASAKAVSWGYKNVYYFRGGIPAWKAAGYPAE